jgi:hypothetical protein
LCRSFAWKNERDQGNFIFFVCIDSPTPGEIPEKIQSTLFQLSFFGSPLPGSLTYEVIRKMVGGELDVHDYVRRIPFTTWQQLISDDDPFDLSQPAASKQGSETEILVRSQRYDRLLFWLSAYGSGSREVFLRACQTLGLDQEGVESRHIFRRLRLLGHLELSTNGSRWSAAPPVLVKMDQSESGEDYFLCGQRNIEILQKLRQVAEVEESPQIEGESPATARIRADDEERLSAALEKSSSLNLLSMGGKVAYRLARLLPPVANWANALETLEGIPLHLFEFKRFEGDQFIPDYFEGKSGFYQLWPITGEKHGAALPKYSLFYDEVSNRWVRGDWYGLRFLARQTDGRPCPVRYDSDTSRLAVPNEWRWPELYERALVLASGQLPKHNGRWLVYEAISPQTFDELRVKLNLQCEEEPTYA